MRKAAHLVAVAVLSVLLLGSVVPFQAITRAQSTPTVGGTFTADMVSEPSNLNPYTLSWNMGFVDAQVYESLLAYAQNLSIVPSLATSYSIDSQAGTYTFQLRQNVTWQDGQPFTANDVKYSFEQIISKYDNFGVSYLANTTVTIENGGQTVVVKPAEFLPGIQLQLFASLDTAILPMHILQGQSFLNSSLINHPMGTGPFMFTTWQKGSYIQLDRNPNYWDKPMPYLNTIVVKFLSDSAAIQAALARNEIDYIFRGVPFESYNTLNAMANLRVVAHPRPPYVAALWLNLNNTYLGDINVRHAMAYAINKTDIAAKATQGLSQPVDFMIDPAVVPPSPTITHYDTNIAKANQLLDQAGYTKGSDGYRFSLQLMTRTGEADEQLFSQIVKTELAQIGINVNIKTVDFGTYLSLQSAGQYDMSTVKYWTSTFWAYQLFDSAWLWKGAFTNNFNYNSSTTDHLFNEWLHASTTQQQVQYLQQVEDQLSQDLPEIVLYQVVWLNVINNNFQGSTLPVGKYIFADSLTNVYDLAAQTGTNTTTTSSSMTTSTAATGILGMDPLLLGAIAVAAIVIVAVAAYALRKRPKT